MNTLEQLSLQGRTALVTGASYGLGTRFAKVLAGAGANTVQLRGAQTNLPPSQQRWNALG